MATKLESLRVDESSNDQTRSIERISHTNPLTKDQSNLSSRPQSKVRRSKQERVASAKRAVPR